MHFMSIEVAAQKFLFPPSEPELTELDEVLNAMKKKTGAPSQPKTKAPFSHNHLHDLESLWWVAVWVVFYNDFPTSGNRPSLTIQDTKDQIKQAQKLFPPVSDSATRLLGFQRPSEFRDICEQLPPEKGHLYDILDVLRRVLIRNYKAIEANLPLPINPQDTDDTIYDHFTNLFSGVKTSSDDLVLDFIPEIYAKLLKSKRPRSESTNDPGVDPKTLKM